MAAYITVGAKTSHGGTVITGSAHTTHNGIPVSRKGDGVICKKCKKLTTILTGDPSFIVDGAPIARAGDVTSCGAKLITVQQSFCEGDFEVMSVAQPEPLQFPKSDPSSMFNKTVKDESYDDKFQLLDKVTQQPLSYANYRLDYEDKSVEGMTDEKGFTKVIEANHPAEVIIRLLVDEDE